MPQRKAAGEMRKLLIIASALGAKRRAIRKKARVQGAADHVREVDPMQRMAANQPPVLGSVGRIIGTI
jgi:hypothetical protein